MTDTYKEANYVLHRFPMIISYNDVNQFTVEGFAKINRGGNTEEKMIVKNLNILDFVIRFLSFLKEPTTVFNENESNIAFDTKYNTFNNRTKPKFVFGETKAKTKKVEGTDKKVTLKYNQKEINFNIEIEEKKNINAIYLRIGY